MTINSQPKYRWYILSLGIVTHIFAAAMPLISISVLSKEISLDLNLDLVQFGVVWGLAMLPSLFGAFAVGLISDKYGSTRTLGVACLLQGVIGALRGISGDFTTLTIFMFFFGLFNIPLGLATHKAAGQWFSGRQLGLANGLLAAGFGVGNMVGALISATILSPLLGGWRNLMFVYGGIAMAIGLLWLIARRSPDSDKTSPTIETVPFRQAFSRVIRIKSVWLLALFQLFIVGYSNGLIGYVPLYLRSVGWTASSADGALATFTAVSIIGAIPLSILSDKIGLRKAILYFAVFMVIIGISLLSIYGSSTIWLSMVLAGIVQEAFFAIAITMLIETEGVGAAYAGTALGLLTMFGGLGGFFGPPIGNRLAEIEPRFAFIFWLFLAVVALIILRFVEETGWRKDRNPHKKLPIGES